MLDNKPYLIYNKKKPFEINRFYSVSFDTSKVNLSSKQKIKIVDKLMKKII